MKTYVISFPKLAIIASVICLVLTLSSCLKDHNTYYAPPAASVSFFQAAPDQAAIDLYFNNNKVNWNPITYGNGLYYFNAYTGLRTINIYSSSTDTKLYSDTMTLKQNNIYSLFLVEPNGQPQIVSLNDTINQPASGQASIRFVDLSPDAPNVDLALNGNVQVSNRGFKGFSSFESITGDKIYNIEVRQKGASTVLASLSNVTLNTGGVYTIVFSGLANGTTSNDKLTVNYITNAYY
ncbi:MAG: DUF4397 domain-containing protein [Mucilaginibacter sp.]|jgi:hypothetical protein